MNAFIPQRMVLAVVVAILTSCATPQQISSGNTNMCINVENHGYPVPGTPVRVKPCDPWRNQQWSLSHGQITGVGGFCLDVQNSISAEGAPVIYVPCDGGPSQNWTASHGTIIGIGGRCVDISGGNPNDWAPLILATCNGSPSQQWEFH
jgi:hypothetical protein